MLESSRAAVLTIFVVQHSTNLLQRNVRGRRDGSLVLAQRHPRASGVALQRESEI
jgi:hypothetical protein